MLGHAALLERSRRLPHCPICRGRVHETVVEMILSTNCGYRFPRVLLQWCAGCEQAVDVELECYPPQCACDSHVETDMADHGAVPCERQLVTVVFESCSACGQVREVQLNH